MEFFIPLAKNKEEAESVLTSTAQFVQCPVPPPNERLYEITFTHKQVRYVAKVGEPIDEYFDAAGPVIVIFGGDPLLVCLRDRGVVRGEPIYVGAGRVEDAVYFDVGPKE